MAPKYVEHLDQKPPKGVVGCPNINRSDSFCNSDKSKHCKIINNITCTVEGVIYLAECPSKKMYVCLHLDS